MKITLAQINTTPNDFSGNFQKIFDGISSAVHDNSDVVIFPELTIPGYLVKDLVYTSGFVEKNLEYLQRIAHMTNGYNITVIVGYIDKNYNGVGKPFRNMAAVIRNGVVITTYQKHLLPFYDVFDEGRYFEPGKDICVFDINGNKCGIVICEDAWNDKGQDDYCYEDNPINKYRDIGVNYLFSLNSSPYAQNKPAYRMSMLTTITNNWNGKRINLIYVNQIGAQDELVFDGHSMIVCNGMVAKYINTDIDSLKNNQEKFLTVDVPANGLNSPYNDYHFDLDHLKMTILGLRDYIIKSGFKQIVLGSSGGVDSALVATLASLAIGADNVNCIMMPSCYSSEGSVNDAKELHKRLGCKEFLVPIEHLALTNHINDCFGFKTLPFIEKYGEYNKVADENIQARMRGQIVMHYSNAMGALALTTGNKTELATGYCTLYGDMNGGFNPIGDLYKLEVFGMCRAINSVFGKLIPDEIINKAPSAELKPGQTDEASLLPYPILDNIVKLYIENYVTVYEQYCELTNEERRASEKDYYRITRLIYLSEFKRRQAAPTIKLSKVAFGTGRRLPIVKK
jgi:NAD+ synthase (glutamine-hydrolysing)